MRPYGGFGDELALLLGAVGFFVERDEDFLRAELVLDGVGAGDALCDACE